MRDDPILTRSPQDRPLPPFPGAEPIEAARFSKYEVTALILSILWIGAVAAFNMLAPVEGGRSLVALSAVMMGPVVAIWGGALALRQIHQLRQEALRLRLTIDGLRQAAAQQAARVTPERKSDDSPAAARAPLAVASVPAPMPLATQSDQSAMAFDAHPEEAPAPIGIDEFIRALNFPESGDDKEGIRCLRLALEDREAARLIRAAQDVLTLLAQDGIFVDDLHPDLAKPELWRRFAQGERGRAVADVGGIRDRSSIALATGRMRSDAIFRDAAHHFLRQFDRSFQAFERHAEDQDLIEFANTRTVRAFMLMGRVTGNFD